MSHFFAIDVETANAALSSICQIGLVEFRDGIEVSAQSWLVDPLVYFDPVNVSVHGISAERVVGSPTFADIAGEIRVRVSNAQVICHTHFDRVAIHQACSKHDLPGLDCEWLDSARIARRTWDVFAQAGYGLANVARHLDIQFNHHDALEDARAAGLIVLRAIEQSGKSLGEWASRSRQPITDRTDRISKDGHSDGMLSGERIVFTGELLIPRRDAAEMADLLGAAVDPSVTKKTTMLVVGDRDISRFGSEKSGKHRKAEDLIGKGQAIRILCEADWKELHAAAV